jgi:DNA (cytosine-5)-methyltransferase 1
LPRDTAKGKPKRKSAANTLTEGSGAGGGIVNAIGASIYHHGTVVNQDVGSGHMVVEGFTSSSFAQYQEGVGTLRSNGGDLGGGSETLIAEPYVKSRRAQSATDDETWVPSEVNPTLNSFDVGDTRATTAIIEPILIDGTRVDDVRVYEPPVQTLGARMGTGGKNVPVIGFSHTQGLSAQPSEDAFPTLRTEGNGMAVAIPIDTRNALRDPEKYDAQNRQGLGIGEDGDPMATLTSTHVNAVAYDEYNDSINETHHALRAGTKQSTGVLLEGEVAGTLRSGGSGGVPSSRGEHLVAEPSMAVRRLTPLECERLMGWPDDHTRYKADGTEQADTHRYKQCGNGVASPVAEWIGKQLMKIETSLEG